MLNISQQPIRDRLSQLREQDAPTHGGRVLSYVYDSGLAELDDLVAEVMHAVQPVNGLDPLTFTSVAVMESEVVDFAREMLNGDADVIGSVTTGGTESCLLAVKTARDLWRAGGGEGKPRLLAPITVHAAFQKAASYFDLELDLVDVDAQTGAVAADRLVSRLGPDVALVVVSAPSYPFAGLDPVAEVASACQTVGISCHVDACIGGWVLPFWPEASDGGASLPAWDFRVPGVSSISADVHKYGYAPKGASILLQRRRDRQRRQFFATTRWPGYPVVNPTMLGSKSAAPLAAAWAIIQALGNEGFTELTASCARSTHALIDLVERIDGLRVFGRPTGPLIAVTADEAVPAERRVDPHHWADQAREHGWVLQLQPGLTQADGSRLPSTTHLTITPVTESGLPDLSAALVRSADEVRGVLPATAAQVLDGLPAELVAQLSAPDAPPPESEGAYGILRQIGLAPRAGQSLPDRMAPFMALIEALPHPLTESLLCELLGRTLEQATAD